MDAPISRNFLKIQFLKLISVMTHFVLEKIDWDFQFSEWIRRFWAFSKKFWAFLKKSIFENFTSVLTHFVWEKIDFEIFNLLDESKDSEHFSKNFELFLKKFIFENFYKCFNPFCMGKKYWISDFQFFGWIIKIYWKFLQVSFFS